MNNRDICKVCGEPLIHTKKNGCSWRHIKIPHGFEPHQPWAKNEWEEAEKRYKDKFCYAEHPIYQMVFCRKEPNHEGNHRARGGIEWSQLVSYATKTEEALE
ncbi:MAG: hypothetical protein M1166_07475 [Candidatus Thermoplasmatota archaeon]|nr:hypothetical protein [Candidatus Thermoplasmatota archaeon]